MRKHATDFRDRSRILQLVGIVMLLVGLGSALLGPIEMYVFYLFSEGGRFHYPGFGFGSFMFGNVASQIIGYYLVAAALLPLAYGNLRVRRWARPLTLTLLGFWLVVGIPVSALFLLVLVSSKEISLPSIISALVVLSLGYVVLPGLMIWFYKSPDTRATFEAKDAKTYEIENTPVPVLVLACLLAFYGIAMHIPIFFHGLFPVFGHWLYGLQGTIALAVTILSLWFLAWGILRLRPWAWWASSFVLVLLTASSVSSLALSTLSDILALMRFAPVELEMLQGTPIEGYHLALFLGIVPIITIGFTLYCGTYFGIRMGDGAAKGTASEGRDG